MLQALCFIVNLRPVQFQGVDEEQLDETVPPDHSEREGFAFWRQANASPGGIVQEPPALDRLHHRGRCSGRNLQSRGDLPHRDRFIDIL